MKEINKNSTNPIADESDLYFNCGHRHLKILGLEISAKRLEQTEY